MPSYTYVVKGGKLLRARGYHCEIIRNEKTSESGCGYSLLISGDCRKAAAVLENYGIPFSMTGNSYA